MRSKTLRMRLISCRSPGPMSSMSSNGAASALFIPMSDIHPKITKN